MKTVTTLLLSGLLLAPLAGCDEPRDEAERAAAIEHASQIERHVESAAGVELEAVAAPDGEPADEDGEEAFYWTEVDDLAAPPSSATCGSGHWEYKSTSPGCNTCYHEDTNTYGKKYDHFQRWCWDGPPACGGCGGWQYTGWGCLIGCW